MRNSSHDVASLASGFFKGFNTNHMILFVGQHANDEDLHDLIADLPWSCVITSRTDAEFGSYFCNYERTPKEYCNPQEIPARPLNKMELPILRLFGVAGQVDEDEADTDDFLKSLGLETVSSAEDRCAKMLAFLPGLLDCINQLIVVGYDPAAANDLPLVRFAALLVKSIPEGNVQFWGMDVGNDDTQKLYEIADRQHFIWNEESLASIVEFWKGSYEGTADENITAQFDVGDIYFKGGNAVGVLPRELLRFRHFAILLTEQTVYAIRPYGRVQQARWFYNFLTLSSTDGPQWYGYFEKSQFYVKRNYEDNLVSLVRKQLAGNDVSGKGVGCPIIVEGDPGSSKSITLGALAYRIYNEHINPVIFIQNDTLSFSNGSLEADELDELMQFIEKSNGVDTRILLVWDSSSYLSVSANAKRLSKLLEDHGRRFVLVCSSYKSVSDIPEKRYYKCERIGNSTKFVECSETEAEVVWQGKCYYLPATRDLEDNERFKLWQKFNEYAGINKERLSLWRKKLENEKSNDIFMYFYKLISLLRPNLENSLSREQRKVNQYVKAQLDTIFNTEVEKHQTTVSQAFQNAGIDLKEFGIDERAFEHADEKDTFSYDLDRFNTCIALFSQFKIEMPYSLAIQLLVNGSPNTSPVLYSTSDKELFNLVTSKIPWLRYGESKSGNDFSFSFRYVLEAEIFLQNKQISGQQQVRFVCDMLELYGEYYKNYRCTDETLESNLLQLLRLMGPNSQYMPFQEGGMHFYVHKDILQNMEQIIDKLKVLLTKYKVPDDDASFASILITFTREYYGRQWNSLHGYTKDKLGTKPWTGKPEFSQHIYLFRLEKIQDALQFASECIDRIENNIKRQSSNFSKKHMSEQRSGLTVELALCNQLIDQLIAEYKECCADLGVAPNYEKSTRSFYVLPYPDIFQRLASVINYDQVNGYAYNALFTAFEHMYNKENFSEERKIQYLSEIMQISDECNGTEILNRGMNGRDEISEHLQRIAQYSSNYRISIDDIHNHTVPDSFYKLYNHMLEMNNPAAITFVCQQELEHAHINKVTSHLNDSQLKICYKIREFMREEQNMECIENNYYALYLLLRVSWMCYNRKPLQDSEECQITTMTAAQWNDIERISSACCGCVVQRPRPIIVLVYALATLQVTGSYLESNRIIETITEDQFYSSARMRVPFMICDERGVPIKHSNGTVISVKNYNGFIRVSDVPNHLGSKTGVRFHLKNLGRHSRMPAVSSVLKDLELGIGYTGFSVYTEEGRKARGEQQ